MNRNKKTKNVKQNKAINDIAKKSANVSDSKEAFHDSSRAQNK